MPRRYDPDRRQRIIDAAIRVVGEKGIAGLSHRSVAAEADVPLGSTTYHFKHARRTPGRRAAAGERGLRQGRRREGRPGGRPRAIWPTDLAGLLGSGSSGDRAGVELEYELYLAALRRPALRPVAAEWADDLASWLARRTDPVTARALVALMDGICLQVLLTGGASGTTRACARGRCWPPGRRWGTSGRRRLRRRRRPNAATGARRPRPPGGRPGGPR